MAAAAGVLSGVRANSLRLAAPLAAVTVVAVGLSTAIAGADVAGGAVEGPADIAVAVGTGVFIDGRVGFRATRPPPTGGLGAGDRTMPERGWSGLHQ